MGLLAMKSHDSMITWFCNITRQRKYNTILYLQYYRVKVLMTNKPDRVVTYLKLLLYIKSNLSWITWSCETTIQCKNNISPLPQCDHQTLQPFILPGGASTHNVIWSVNDMVFGDHKINWTFYISCCTRPVNTKHSKIATYGKRLSPIRLHNA